MDLHENIYNMDGKIFESPTEIEPSMAIGGLATTAMHGPRGARGRNLHPIPHRVPVRKNPLALDENYAIAQADTPPETEEKAEEKSKAPLLGGEKENVVERRASLPVFGPGSQHAIARFPNRFKLIRRPSLPLATQLGTPDPHRRRGLARAGAPSAAAPPFKNLTNAGGSTQPKPTVDYAACITSWSACADDEQNWENGKGEAMGTPMIEYLHEHPRPTYDELLTQLASIMRNNGKERERAWKQVGLKEKVVFQRPQLGSLKELNLKDYMTI